MDNGRGWFERQRTKGNVTVDVDDDEVTQVVHELEPQDQEDGRTLDERLKGERLMRQWQQQARQRIP